MKKVQSVLFIYPVRMQILYNIFYNYLLFIIVSLQIYLFIPGTVIVHIIFLIVSYHFFIFISSKTKDILGVIII